MPGCACATCSPPRSSQRGPRASSTLPSHEGRDDRAVAARADDAPPVIKKIHKQGAAADPLRGLFGATIAGKRAVVEFEPDPDLRDTEQVPLLEEGGIS